MVGIRICAACLCITTAVSAAAGEQTEPWARDPAAITEQYLTGAHELMRQAFALLGIRYRYGGATPAIGFDCSGFVRYVFDRIGTVLPHGAAAISQYGRKVQLDELQPGDLVFFDTRRRPYSHVGIYVGDERFIHAPSRGGRIEIVNMSDRYWARRYNGARRVDL